jgi:hypothetical protein
VIGGSAEFPLRRRRRDALKQERGCIAASPNLPLHFFEAAYFFFLALAFFFAGIIFSSQFFSANNTGGARIQHHV